MTSNAAPPPNAARPARCPAEALAPEEALQWFQGAAAGKAASPANGYLRVFKVVVADAIAQCRLVINTERMTEHHSHVDVGEKKAAVEGKGGAPGLSNDSGDQSQRGPKQALSQAHSYAHGSKTGTFGPRPKRRRLEPL